MREEMPHGGAGRAGGLVQVDGALLGCHEQRESRDGLGDRGQQHGTIRVAAGCDRRLGRGHADGGERGVPVVDLEKCLHAGRY